MIDVFEAGVAIETNASRGGQRNRAFAKKEDRDEGKDNDGDKRQPPKML
jgi:hypothetical protein